MDSGNPFVGSWAYRSFLNDPDLSKEFNDLRFGVGTLVLEEPDYGRLSGSLGGEGWNLDLVGGYTYGATKTLARGLRAVRAVSGKTVSSVGRATGIRLQEMPLEILCLARGRSDFSHCRRWP
jgi:hypothetical protein